MYSKNRLHQCKILDNALNNNRLHSNAQEQNSQYSNSQHLTPQCFNEQNPKHCTTLEQNAQYGTTQQYCTVDHCSALLSTQLYCTLFYCTALFYIGSDTATFIVIYLLASYHQRHIFTCSIEHTYVWGKKHLGIACNHCEIVMVLSQY